jgi:putative tryptophan/tyrosine transport system substrate-binding protein
MQRRIFIEGIAALAAAWPVAARAQRSAMPVIGFLSTAASTELPHLVAAFHEGLKEAGYVEGQNVLVEYRWAENQVDRLPALLADLVRRQVQVIVATPASSWKVAKAATSSIPIVFEGGGDPVKLGIVASLIRPGGNVTGVVNASAELAAKRLDVMRELVPTATQIAVLVNPNNAIAQGQLQDSVTAAKTTRQEISVVNATNRREIDDAFATAVQRHAGVILVTSDDLFTDSRGQLVALAARHAIPAVYPFRDYADAGGLISYGPNLADAWHKTGAYTGRILQGAKPADLPVLLPTKFELVINLKAAKALRLKVPDKLLALADEVIDYPPFC